MHNGGYFRNEWQYNNKWTLARRAFSFSFSAHSTPVSNWRTVPDIREDLKIFLSQEKGMPVIRIMEMPDITPRHEGPSLRSLLPELTPPFAIGDSREESPPMEYVSGPRCWLLRPCSTLFDSVLFSYLSIFTLSRGFANEKSLLNSFLFTL